MALNNQDQAQLRDYLLGKLSGEEQQKIEERLMVEDDLSDVFEVSKDELIEDYCAGNLAQNEREWLEENFLATSDGRERHAFALAMDCLQRKRPAPLPNDVVPEPVWATNPPAWIPKDQPVGFFAPLQAFARTQPWAFAATSLLLVLLAAFAITRFAARPDGQIFSATLTNGSVVRSEGPPPPRFILPPNTGQLKLRLQLRKTAAEGTHFKAQLDDGINLKSVQMVASDPESVTVIVPAELLTRGEYQLQLTTTKPDGTEQELYYPFNVQ